MIQKFRAPRRAFGLCVLVALAVVAFSAATATGASPARIGGMQVSPQATPAGPVGDYGLFSCQVGRSTGQCYDPYQMRKAYGVDSLIAQGYDGTGKTIVILDAFHALLAMEQGEPGPAVRAQAAPAAPVAITDELVNEVTRRVLERLAPNAARDLVRQVVGEVAERLIREEIARIKGAVDAKR